jgi:hypothetical protein
MPKVPDYNKTVQRQDMTATLQAPGYRKIV